jgi:hypothetical protein
VLSRKSSSSAKAEDPVSAGPSNRFATGDVY